jgi:hypothetical protein
MQQEQCGGAGWARPLQIVQADAVDFPLARGAGAGKGAGDEIVEGRDEGIGQGKLHSVCRCNLAIV